MPRRDVDLESLWLLRAVHRTGSISKAAGERRMAQPSASTRIRRLEQVTGLPLLEKTPTGSVLTVAGERFMAEADGVLDAVERLHATVDGMRRRATSSLRVAASYTIAEYLINEWLDASDMLGRGLHFGLEVGNSVTVCALVAQGLADLGFVESPDIPAELDSTVVAEDELILVAPPAHPWVHQGHIDASRLAHSSLIMRERGSGTREYAETRIEQVLGSPLAEPSQELGSTAAVKAAVAAGGGATILSRLAVGRELKEGRLHAIELAGVDLRRQLRAVVRRGVRHRGAARDLIATARQVGAS